MVGKDHLFDADLVPLREEKGPFPGKKESFNGYRVVVEAFSLLQIPFWREIIDNVPRIQKLSAWRGDGILDIDRKTDRSHVPVDLRDPVFPDPVPGIEAIAMDYDQPAERMRVFLAECQRVPAVALVKLPRPPVDRQHFYLVLDPFR